MSASSIMNFFRGGSSPMGTLGASQGMQQQPLAPQQQQTNQQAQQTNTQVPNPERDGVQGNAPVAFGKPKEEGEQSPLDNFTDLFKTDPAKANTQSKSPLPNLTVDPAKLSEAFKNVDFTAGIDPALLDKASKGDGASMMQVLKQQGQSILSQSSIITAKVVEGAISELHNNYQRDVIPQVLRNNAISNAVNENPIFQHPAAAPMLAGLKTQFIQQYPQATASEIADMANNYLDSFARQVIGQDGTLEISTKAQPKVGAVKETNWLTYAQGVN